MLLFALYSNINIKSLAQVAYITVGGCDTNIFQLFSVFFPCPYIVLRLFDSL